MTEQSPSQIVVNKSAFADNLFALLRQLMLIVGPVLAIIGFLNTHDFVGLVAYLRGNDLYPAIGAVMAIGSLIYGQLRTWWNKRRLVKTATAAPDRVAVVVDEGVLTHLLRKLGWR